MLLVRSRQMSIDDAGRHHATVGGPSLADQRRLAAFNRSENSSAPSSAAQPVPAWRVLRRSGHLVRYLKCGDTDTDVREGEN